MSAEPAPAGVPSPPDVEALMAGVLARLRRHEGADLPAPAGPGREGLEELRRRIAAARQVESAFGRHLPLSRRGPLGWLEGLAKRAIRKLLAWHARPQQDFNALAVRALVDAADRIEALSAEVERLAAELAALKGERELSGGGPGARG